MERKHRKELIAAIEEKRGTKVICFITSDRPGLSTHIAGDVVPIIHQHVLALESEERTKIDLLVYSRGGDSDVPWTIVSMLREYGAEGSLGVLIPYRAHSAATIIALGADEIVMGKKAELGPIDITLTGPYNPTAGAAGQPLPISVEDVTGYFSLLRKVGCERPPETMDGFRLLTEKVHPLALGSVSRLLQQTELVALRMLGTRANPFSEEKNRDIVRKLSSEIFSHRHTISRTEAIRHLGLDQIIKSEDAGIMDELWGLYEAYRDAFSLEEPFKGEQEMFDKDLDEMEWNGMILTCVESLARVDFQKARVRMQRLRQVPPTVNLNLNLPPITIQGQGQDAHALLVPTLQAAAQEAAKRATEELKRALPTTGFQTIQDTEWVCEEAK